MKNSQIVITVLVVALIGIFVFNWSKRDSQVPVNNTPPVVTSSLVGCYVAGTSQDIYTLNIQSVNGDNFSGTLAFKNFEKDSSSGTFVGTYINGILLGDYSFQSEGTFSVMQVIFKKSGDNFIRGYGDVGVDGTRFVDVNKITYDSSSSLNVFTKGECS